LSRYIQLTTGEDPSTKIYVYSSEPKITYEEFLFFTNNYNNNSAKIINNRLNSGVYLFENVLFLAECPPVSSLDTNTIQIIDPLLGCNIDKKSTLRITRFQDVLEKYLIKGDFICGKFQLNTYVTPKAFENFNVGNEDSETFFRNWITKL
jgi:hypothetical protein